MEAGEWGGIITAVFFGALALGGWLGWLVGRDRAAPIINSRVVNPTRQLQALVRHLDGSRVWRDVEEESEFEQPV